MYEFIPSQGVLGWVSCSYPDPKRTTKNLPWVRGERRLREPHHSTCECKAMVVTDLAGAQKASKHIYEPQGFN
jgi:hypothetical protein